MHAFPPGEIFPAPRTFFWLPLDGARHAVEARDRETANGEPVSTLCDRQLIRARVSDIDWLWPTCPACWDAAVQRVGLRP